MHQQRDRQALSLSAEPTSVRQARRHVRRTLTDAGREAWVDAAELVVSELVTNVVLHAHSGAELTVDVRDDRARIEVRDFNPALPSQRDYDDHATTGRGLELIVALTLEHGVRALEDGKVVWASVGDDRTTSEDDLLDAWTTPEDTSDEGSGDSVGVTLLGLPPTLWLAAMEHHDALLRELALLELSGGPVHADLSAVDQPRSTLDGAVQEAVEEARRRGEAALPLPQYHPGALPEVPETVDLQLQVEPSCAPSFAAMQDALDEAEALARADRLLVRAGLPEIVAVRDWAAEQVIAQVGGSPPGRWPGADDDRFVQDRDRSDLPEGGDLAQVAEADVGVVAVDQGNRIVAVSRPLARTVGWEVDDLVGRRVVAIVPPRFREAHVAGFSRHLSTGHARALCVDLVLPVLRADGEEVDCRFLIASQSTGQGQVLYLAWITPLEA